MVTRHSFLAPGQRYARSGFPVWRAADQFTVLVVGKDRVGKIWVTFRGPDGEDFTRLAAQFEAGIAAGEIVPLTPGPIASC
jgi:hypothetical protein